MAPQDSLNKEHYCYKINTLLMKKTQKNNPTTTATTTTKMLTSPFRRQLSPIWALTPFLQEHLEP